MHLQSATPSTDPNNLGAVELVITDIPATAQSFAVRVDAPVTPDNGVGFKQIQNYKRSAAWQAGKALKVIPAGFQLGVLLNVYVIEQVANQTADVGMPSNSLPIICGPPQG